MTANGRIEIPKQELTRRAMYDLVWARPMVSVADDFGISDVALKKICKKHRVPTPPRGHWAKKEAGKPVRQIRFHEATDPQDELIVIYGSRSNFAPEIREVLDQERERRKGKSKTSAPVESISVPPAQEIHPAISGTARALRKVQPNKYGVVRATGNGHCGIVVGTTSVERAIAVLDLIARALELRGLKLEPTGSSMSVSIPPDTLTFTLVERIEKRKHVPTVEELANEDRLRKKKERDARLGIWSFNNERAYPELDFIRTGEFCIQIAEQYVGGLRRNWNDGKHQRIEDLADEIADGIAAYLVGVKLKREEHERWNKEWKRRQHLQALARAREERETHRREFLEHLVGISTEADELKSLLKRLHERLPVSPSADLTRLIEWTEARLRRLEGELMPEGISDELRKQGLFPELDPLSAPEPEGD